MKKPYLLCVDDEQDNVDALERLFRKKFEVLKATSGKEGLEILKDHDVSVIISDQRMPQMEGVQFLKKSIDICPEAIRILLTGYTDIDSVIGAINNGEVYKYMTKPWDPVDLLNTTEKASEKFTLRRELQQKNKELEVAYEELKTLDQAKNQFMVLINHELKTPLTVIMSFLDLLKESKVDDEQSLYIGKIQKGVDRLEKLVNDVLELVSAETGITKVNKKKIKCNDLSEKLKTQFAEKMTSKEQSLKINANVDSFKADPAVIEQVLVRILDNACKFGKKSEPIHLGFSQDADGVRVSVKNTGKSLNKKMIENILKPFTLDENMLNHSEGLGLGLSLSQALLKTHDSYLEILSEKDQVEVSFVLN